MARVRINLDKAGLRADANRLARPDVVAVTRRVFNRSQILCPVGRTGYLRSKGKTKFGEAPKGPRGIVEYTAKYSAAVHDGSVPHEIRARRKKALKFQYEGKIVIVKSVRHPGSDPRPFLRTAAVQIARSEGYRFLRR